ncbi:IMP dehydrogenase [Moesziomyces antarcticus T-34]|uniref:IMP dehydrogenase n=1 Tax=Pseudozyma antarctica (strain T-34) TaxID=1151754 RepID=M9M664_PSEA3|nr:IMP dehydrogenase [Moesziomyces antarcticus T-34]
MQLIKSIALVAVLAVCFVHATILSESVSLLEAHVKDAETLASKKAAFVRMTATTAQAPRRSGLSTQSPELGKAGAYETMAFPKVNSFGGLEWIFMMHQADWRRNFSSNFIQRLWGVQELRDTWLVHSTEAWSEKAELVRSENTRYRAERIAQAAREGHGWAKQQQSYERIANVAGHLNPGLRRGGTAA